MTTAASTPAPGPRAAAPNWLYGPSVDLLFGYGLGYVVAVPLLVGASFALGRDPALFWIAGLISILVITPHYGATALRVYEQRDERRKYAVFAFGATGVLLLLFAMGLRDRMLGSLVLTLYLTWSPWHFSGQNYGLAVLYLRRNGVALPAELKRPLYASFVSSALLAMLAVHVSHSDKVFAQVSDYTGTFQLQKLGIPYAPGMVLTAVVAAAHCLCLATFWSRVRRATTLSLLPVGLLVATQALWFTIPASALAFGAPALGALLPFTAFTISAAHSAQYLWVTSYYERLGRARTRGLPFLGKALLAGGVLGLPALLFIPGLLGPLVPNGAGALMLGFAVLNLHHFILDGAIWKLRDGRIARALLRAQTADSDAPASQPPRRWLRNLVLALGCGVVAIEFHAIALRYQVYHAEDPAQLGTVRDQLAFLGRDGADAWMALGRSLDRSEQKQAALDAYRQVALRQAALEPWVANRLALLLIELHGSDAESLREATDLALYVSESLGDSNSQGQQTLARAHAAAGEGEAAAQAWRRAAVIARANGQAARAAELEGQAQRALTR